MKYYLGIDIGGTNIAVGLVTAQGELLTKQSTKTLCPRPAEDICRDTADLCRKVVADYGLTMDQIAAVGVGCPGVIMNGVVHRATNLKFRDAPVAALLQQALERPVALANDADAAAYGEFMVCWDGKPDPFVVVTIGTGVGGGIIIDGKVRPGFNGAGGEVGHTAIRVGGRKCPCGRTGCFERYCSANALTRDTLRAMALNKDSKMWQIQPDRSQVTPRVVFEAARQGDEAARKVLDYYIENMAAGLKNVISLLQPQVLCIGGGVSMQEDELIQPLARKIAGISLREGESERTRICAAKLHNDAGIIGAALLGRKLEEEA